jgi:DTW domain-containing protein YfiP
MVTQLTPLCVSCPTATLQWPADDALEPQQLLELAQQRGTRIALIALDGTWDCARKMKSRYPPGLLMLKVPPHLALPDASRQRQQQWEQQQQQQQQRPEQQQADPEASTGVQAQPQGVAAGSEAGAAVDPAATSTSSTPSSSRSRSSSANGRVSGGSNSTSNTDTNGISHKHHHQHFQGQPASLFRPLRKYQGNAAQNGRVCTLEAVAGALLALEGDEAMYDGLLHALKLKVDAMRRQKHMEEVYGTTAAERGDS